jgi:uncharacterized repeat protein (TIGR01451 family)/uncharacterized repeat protein (TIGR02543 family)
MMITRSSAWWLTCVFVLALAGSAHADVFFDRAFGFGVDTGAAAFENCTTASECQTGVESTDAGALRPGPAGLAVDAEGRILVTEESKFRVNRFLVAPDGTVSFDRAFGWGVQTGAEALETCTAATGCLAGLLRSLAGSPGVPTGITTDAQGRILVVGDLMQRVSRYVIAPDGSVSFDRAFGLGVRTNAAVFENCTTATGCQQGLSTGGAGGLFVPVGIAIDAEGRILVVESFGNRVSRYVVNGDDTVSFDRAFGFGVQTGAAALENCTTATGCQNGSASAAAGGLNAALGVAVDAEGRILVTSQANHRVDRFVVGGDGTVSFDRAWGVGVRTGSTTAFENCTAATGCVAGSTSAATGGLGATSGIAVDARGRVLVSDGLRRRVSRFVEAGDGSMVFDRAFGMGVDSGAAEFQNCTTASVCQAGPGTGGAGDIGKGWALTVDGQQRILVGDETGFRVSRFTMFRVTYDANGATGGAVPVDDQNYETGDPVTVAANVGGLVRTGHTFAGWNTQANGGGTTFNATGADTFAMGTAHVTLFARWIAQGDLSIVKAHASTFSRGQVGATYQITVTNVSPVATAGVVTVTDTLPAGLIATGIAGTGWTCVLGTLTCTRADALAPSAAYPVIVLTVNVATTAPLLVINTATVSGGGNDVNPANNSTSDPTAIVPADALGHPFLVWIAALIEAGITGGCSLEPPLYCPEDTVSRGQMALFLLRGIHGPGFQPPAPTGLFTDVPVTGDPSTTHPFAAWIEQLAREGITGGCGANLYCPDAGVTRAQMAIFLLRAKHGPGHQPPAPTGVFADVPVTGNPATTHPQAAWIEQLFSELITGGCGGNLYCPDDTVTRGQMAVFLIRAFGLPL